MIPPLTALRAFEAASRCGSFSAAAEELSVTQSAVSHQLRTLRTARLVEFTKRGRHVYYRLADKHVQDMLDDVVSHSQEAW